MNELARFVTDQTGKVGVGNTPANRGECVGLVAVWFDTELEPHVWGNAKDLFANAAAGYTKGTSWPAPAGSAIVLNGLWGGGVGHTGLSLGDGRIFEQNNPKGSTPHVSNYGGRPNGYTGWILPNNFKGDEVMSNITREQEKVLSLMATGSYPGKDYDYRFTGKLATQENIDAMLQFWQGQVPKTRAEAAQVTELAPGLYRVK